MFKPGIYPVSEILDTLGFEMVEDFRRVKIGGLGFDYLDSKIRIPESAKTIEVTLDGEVVATGKVK